VLEVPTWRWSKYDCESKGMTRSECNDKYGNSPYRQIQERAWTSPIWNLP
jgi:hypothetical protein